jgi:Rod binding domain-containing protein
MAGQLLPLPTMPATSLPPVQVARAWKAAQDFEAMAIGQFLQPMFQTVDLSKSLFGGGEAESTWQPMLTTEIAKTIEQHGGLGLAMPVFREMLRMQEARTPNVSQNPKENQP